MRSMVQDKLTKLRADQTILVNRLSEIDKARADLEKERISIVESGLRVQGGIVVMQEHLAYLVSNEATPPLGEPEAIPDTEDE